MFGRGVARITRDAMIATALVVLLSIWFFHASTHAYAPNADGATVVLEGSALIHGHPLLQGWSLSLDSFWSVDALFYALAVAIFGVGPGLMHLVPAVLLALCVGIGVVVVTRDLNTRQRVVGVGLLGVMLCLPSHTAAYFLLQGPWHVATTLYCLIALLWLSRPGWGWRWVGAVGILALGLTGDLQTASIGIVPIALAACVAMARQRSVRAGLGQLSAAVAACIAAIAIRLVASAIGTFAVHENHHTVKVSQLGVDVGHFINWISAIFGIHNGPVPGSGIPVVVVVARSIVLFGVLASFLVALVSLGAGVIGMRRRPLNADVNVARLDDRGREIQSWRIDDLLVCMTLGSIATFGLLTLSNNTAYARYLDPVVIFSSILAARVLGRFFGSRPARVWMAACGTFALVFGLGVWSSVSAASVAIPTAPTAALERYLVSHHLTNGIGDYWDSSIVTVDTRNAVTIRPVVANLVHEIVPDGRQATIDWYRTSPRHRRPFQFVVYQRKPYGRVERATIERTFGPPSSVVAIGRYFVVTWAHPVSVALTPFP